MRAAYILAACRTPACRANKGKFRQQRPDDLAAAALRGLLARTGIDPAELDDVIFGCAFPEGEQGMNVARIAALKAGIPVAVPAQTINRFCSSGLQSIATAANAIGAGQAEAIIAGGVESMSLVPMGGSKFSANPGLVGSWPEVYAGMGITGELVAAQYAIAREAQDRFALASHQKAAAAVAAGHFIGEIVPVEIENVAVVKNKIQRSTELVTADDGVRADTTFEGLSKLKPAFKVDGSITAGNASQMTDGAAAVLVVSEEYLKRLGQSPVARFVAFAVKGVAPEVMGIGPVAAIPAALQRAGLKLSDLGLIELNEAFAAQALAVMGELGLDPALVNVNGGAIALGHPLGCTGSKLTATLLAEMARRQTRYGMVSMCIGGGMGAAGIFERV
ncbi:MAG: acetyl-CoA acetyltransferase [Desulfuromonadales bacterium GWD2_61_12]|nr:MAG: acetyl-CoA acetyltransferase [Desulfuromonadales bacterium GWC2_61_20]OGR32826.1 MAG: acetyl-CoA acetyltransferase [Desulfuromonadales bacterium GWD2_61_12]HAD04299.1 acetyl-CoA C-acyltransferase [Desulfuromonas sp.]HBT82499.1 acetyl-CoA C-acyltransferase [Desulfuromonas sp.]